MKAKGYNLAIKRDNGVLKEAVIPFFCFFDTCPAGICLNAVDVPESRFRLSIARLTGGSFLMSFGII